MKTRPVGYLRMPSLTHVAAAILAFALVGLAAIATAQSIGKANIDFAFVAGKAQFAAGPYEFEVNNAKAMLTLRAKDPKAGTVMMPIITRLGRHDKDQDTELIFDKVNNQLLLSEVWLPNEDGYLLLNTPVNHEHRVVGGSNPRK
jgi:hypothetical protein